VEGKKRAGPRSRAPTHAEQTKSEGKLGRYEAQKESMQERETRLAHRRFKHIREDTHEKEEASQSRRETGKGFDDARRSYRRYRSLAAISSL
jgi:hypothetical protein